MLKRKIERQLTEWKNISGHKPLIVKGCRQCGKTFSVLDFAKKNYKHVVYLNFFENPDYASVFAGSLEIDNIVMLLSALLGKDAVFEAGETVLVLDEIQDCPEARTALKFFRIDGRYDVIGTGSLLGVKGYFHKDSGLEVDFVIRYKGACTLVEVKAATGNIKSTKTILNHPEKYHVSSAIKLGDYNVGRMGQVLTLPLYMAFLLRTL